VDENENTQCFLIVSEEGGNRSTIEGVYCLDSYTGKPYNIESWDMQSVVETEDFLRDVKSLKLTEGERDAIVSFIAANPMSGDEIKGTGGARKTRFARNSKGKRGGCRVITFYSGKDIPVFLINIFAKNEKTNLTQSEKNRLRAVLSNIVDTYHQERK